RLSARRLETALEYIQAHLGQGEDLTLAAVARQVGYSPYHFARLFHRATGESLHQLVLRERGAAARGLLRETEPPPPRVAEEAGTSAPPPGSSASSSAAPRATPAGRAGAGQVWRGVVSDKGRAHTCDKIAHGSARSPLTPPLLYPWAQGDAGAPPRTRERCGR